MKKHNGFIQTVTGKKFYPLDPQPEDICIEDIAYALSNICRYTGHCHPFFCVSDHSIRVSYMVSPANALWGLLHDAPEAYISDIARPVKYLAEMEPYRKIEKGIMDAVAHKFGLCIEEPEEVQRADMVLGRTEARDFKLITAEWSNYKVIPLKNKVVPISSKKAEKMFLKRFHELTEK